jgi:uncharacterized membrane protein
MTPKSWKITLCLVLAWLIVGASISPVLAQEGQIQQSSLPLEPNQNLTLFTSYPAQETAIGEDVTFELTLRTATTAPELVRLEAQNLPTGWTASFRGGGRVVEAAYVEPENDTKVDLRVDPPQDVKPGDYRRSVIARGESGQVELPIELIVKEKLPPSLELSVDLPTLKGTPSTTFRYNAKLKNVGDEDLTINLLAETPKGFQASFKLTGQDVTSIPLAANETKTVNVEIAPFPDTPAGQYQFNVSAQGGEVQAQTTLIAEVTGQPELAVTAPDGRLSGQAYAGNTTPLKLVVQNTGSAPARDIELSASPPNGWQVEFEPKRITEISSGQQLEVTANIQPADQAVAGDYVITLRATPNDGPAESAEFRVTVLTSTLWGVVGIGLIAIAVAVVGLAVARFGRR